jgi:ribosome-associated translation inhibitor RaiA
MDIPLELVFHNLEPSDALKEMVREQVAGLERFYDHIIGCRVVIEMPHKSHRPGQNDPDIHVVLRVPGQEIAVTRGPHGTNMRGGAADVYGAVRETFHAAQARLKDYKRQTRGEVKTHAGGAEG